MNKKTPQNPRNAGRKKHIGKRYAVICHPKVILDVRKYAKEKSEEQFKREENERK